MPYQDEWDVIIQLFRYVAKVTQAERNQACLELLRHSFS